MDASQKHLAMRQKVHYMDYSRLWPKFANCPDWPPSVAIDTCKNIILSVMA